MHFLRAVLVVLLAAVVVVISVPIFILETIIRALISIGNAIVGD